MTTNSRGLCWIRRWIKYAKVVARVPSPFLLNPQVCQQNRFRTRSSLTLFHPLPHREQWPTPLPHQSTPTVCIRKTSLLKKRSASRYLHPFHQRRRYSSTRPHSKCSFNSSRSSLANLAYSVNDEGLKAFFAPVQSDMYVCNLHSLIQFFGTATFLSQSKSRKPFSPVSSLTICV